MQVYLKLTVCVILISIIPNCFGIKCFDCRSTNDPKCADPFDNSTVAITDCDQERGLAHLPGVRANMCRKVKQKVNGQWIYIRGCAYPDEASVQGEESLCLTSTGSANVKIEYCTCNNKDACNTSFTFKPTLSLFTLAALPMFMVKFLNI